MSSHDYYGTPPNQNYDQGPPQQQPGYDAYNVPNPNPYPPQHQGGGGGGGYGQDQPYPPQTHSPYPHDQSGYSQPPGPAPYIAPSYDQQQQQQQQQYGAPPPGAYDQSYDHNRGQSPYPPSYQQQQHHQGGYGTPGAHGSAPGPPLPGPGGQEGERGLGSTLVGSVGGAFLGHKMGGGPLGTVGGMVAGAIGANMLDSKHDKKKERQKAQNE